MAPMVCLFSTEDLEKTFKQEKVKYILQSSDLPQASSMIWASGRYPM